MEIAYTTAPRNVVYIGVSLATHEEQGCLPKPTIYCEPGSPLFAGHSRYEKVWNTRNLGVCKNWAKALIHAKENILICQDDIFWPEGSGKMFMDQVQRTPDNIISPYTSYSNAKDHEGWAIFTSVNGLCGALSLYIPLKYRDELLRYVMKYCANIPRGVGLDAAVGQFVMINNIRMWQHTPTLIQHLGIVGTGGRPLTKNTAYKYENREPCLAPVWLGKRF